MKNKDKLIDVLKRHHLIDTEQRFELMHRVAIETGKAIERRPEFQILVLGAIADGGDWESYSNYAFYLSFQFFDEVPHAWAALALGMRKRGRKFEADQFAKIGMELCPMAIQTQIEACRMLCSDGKFELAKKYRDSIIGKSDLYRKAFESDPDFREFEAWLAKQEQS